MRPMAKETHIKTDKNPLTAGVLGSYANLSNSDVLNIEIAVPPTSEQLEIAEFLRKQVEIFKSLVGNGQSAIGLLKERRTALISAAVTGKIDVRDWQAPVAPSQDIASGTTQDTHP